MPSLITGAGGFIGGRLQQALSSSECPRLLVRGSSTPRGSVSGDLLDPVSLRAACREIDGVFHCAGYAHAFSATDPDRHWRINYEGTCNMLRAAGEAGVRRFVFLSSVKAMAEPGLACADEEWPGEPATPYGRAKRAAEDAVREAGLRYGMHVVILRLAMVYGHGGRGNLERMAHGMRRGWFPPLPETGNRRSLVHVDDVVAAMRLAADAPAADGRTYIVADPRAYSGAEIYACLRAALGRSPASWRVPALALRSGGRLGDFLQTLAGRPFPLNSEAIDRLLASACYSPARIERELGWRAGVELAAGLREMLGMDATDKAVLHRNPR